MQLRVKGIARMAEKQLTPEQQKFLDVARNASARCFRLASEADNMGMPILAREFDYLGKELDAKITLQLQAFRDHALASEM